MLCAGTFLRSTLHLTFRLFAGFFLNFEGESLAFSVQLASLVPMRDLMAF